MKKTVFYLLSLLLLGSANAKPVDAVTARRVAETWLMAQGWTGVAALVDVTDSTPFTEFYVFAAPTGGFVLVSGDDCVVPVLGYSAGNRFDTGVIPGHVEAWLRESEGEIRYWRALEAAGGWRRPDEVARQWEMLASGTMPPMAGSKAMNDTLTTQWAQGRFYNMLCPADTGHSSGHVVTGCVATSMAMVMKYWNFPDTGYLSHGYEHSVYGSQFADYGTTAYQWNMMPARLTSATSYAQDTAVALLMYHAGVSVEMNYGPGGSGAQTVNSGNFTRASQENSLIRYFKYSPALHSVYYGDFGPGEWEALMAGEIDSGRPVLYSGSGSGGHAFVLDGYNTDGYFHFNWGWSGSYNGYYPIGGLTPGTTHNYNKGNKANVGVQPNLAWGTGGTVTVATSDSVRGSVSPSTTYSFGDTVWVEAYPNHGYRFNGWDDRSPFITRGIYGTGGDYGFSANFEPVGTDTVILYGGGQKMTSYGWPSQGEYSWGLKIDGSYMQHGRELHGVELFIGEAGSYDMTVYLGTHNDRYRMFDTTFVADSMEVDQWKTVEIHAPVVVDGWQSMWIIFHKVTTGYPACVTTYSGIDESFISVSGGEFNVVGGQRNYSVMARGLFRNTSSLPVPRVYASCTEQIPVGGTATFTAEATPGATAVWTIAGGTPSTATGNEVQIVFNSSGTYQAIATITVGGITASDTTAVLVIDYTEGNTVSYCLDRPSVGVTLSGGDTSVWGIMFPSSFLHGRDYLNEVQLYVSRPGDYTLYVYQGGDTVPGALVYTKTYDLQPSQESYCACIPDSLVRIDTTQNLWIVFGSTLEYPITFCNYMGDPNSNWLYYYGRWVRLYEEYPTLPFSWMIKAVTSTAVPIDEAEDETLRVFVREGRIVVDGAAGEPVMVYDVMGRQVHNHNLPSGVYLVKFGTRPARKVVVVR